MKKLIINHGVEIVAYLALGAMIATAILKGGAL